MHMPEYGRMVQCNACTEGSHDDCIAVHYKSGRIRNINESGMNVKNFSEYVILLTLYIVFMYMYIIILYYIDFIQWTLLNIKKKIVLLLFF